MQTAAVQRERDRNGHRVKGEDNKEKSGISVVSLQNAERKCQKFNYSPATSTTAQNSTPSTKVYASINDVYESMQEQLIYLVEWAKNISEFNELSLQDQITLLRSNASNHLVLGVARRSLHLDGVLLLGNNCILVRQVPGEFHYELQTDIVFDLMMILRVR